MVKQRKAGNQVYYKLTQPELANCLLQGLAYLKGGLGSDKAIRSAVNEVKALWAHAPDNPFKDDGSNA